ncbi:hypothetical protein ES703_115264 [subsurface metagenome]
MREDSCNPGLGLPSAIYVPEAREMMGKTASIRSGQRKNSSVWPFPGGKKGGLPQNRDSLSVDQMLSGDLLKSFLFLHPEE